MVWVVRSVVAVRSRSDRYDRPAMTINAIDAMAKPATVLTGSERASRAGDACIWASLTSECPQSNFLHTRVGAGKSRGGKITPRREAVSDH